MGAARLRQAFPAIVGTDVEHIQFGAGFSETKLGFGQDQDFFMARGEDRTIVGEPALTRPDHSLPHRQVRRDEITRIAEFAAHDARLVLVKNTPSSVSTRQHSESTSCCHLMYSGYGKSSAWLAYPCASGASFQRQLRGNAARRFSRKL